jgi:hypothetical protein
MIAMRAFRIDPLRREQALDLRERLRRPVVDVTVNPRHHETHDLRRF